MRIFVTGGTGFIGSPVVKLLEKNGHKLMVLSRSKSARDKKTIFIKGDLANVSKWKRELIKFRTQAVLHMAWENLPSYDFDTNAKNLKHGLNLFELLAEIKCKKIVALGTCWEYGKSGKMSEDMMPDPVNIFAATKDVLRRLGEQLAKENKINFIWLRPFFVYGPGQRKDSLIPYLLDVRKQGAKSVIKNPKGGNDFIYIDDIARAIVAVLEKCNYSTIYNIGSGKLTPVLDIVGIIYGNFFKKPKSSITGFYADISKIKKEIGWEPKISLSLGIRKTIDSNERK